MTEFHWVNHQPSPLKLHTFLKHRGVTRSQLKRIKFHGGAILVNQQPRYPHTMLQPGDRITLCLPPEPQNPHLQVSHHPVQILFEDDNYLIVNKPANVATVPSHLYPNDTLVNRVLGYYCRKETENRVIHVVNRLDRGTSGPVIFAKHSFAHSLVDRQLQQHRVRKEYVAVVTGRVVNEHASIVLPIGRKPGSFLARMVLATGRYSRTEFWRVASTDQHTLVKIRLHTGRTHQIRVHFAALGLPLVGDWLYNPTNHELDHQALHCYRIAFWDQLGQQMITVTTPWPAELRQLMQPKKSFPG
ncbi:RluA family pseudouridine synthase [Fructilactobacillus myrtifloralis]|uniref:Pseudouridine synthase n=1 Tax=Fructilactobacillus myrtifloralis TaxID=2940301 RepID=A0ABY5BRJ8_9LACO|nr:RluA family pseudouridine synthase [Fructilactobacillus myrtifloralis]USS85536.1 RluA family pseudouridine synthase [Fructilactobacillus myrtifloralis]